jgi:hypothetical protein
VKGPAETLVRRPAASVGAAAVALAMTLAALSLWTVVPVGWVWIGSRIASSQFPSGLPYMVTFAGIVASILVMAWLIGRLNRLFVRLTGSESVASVRPTWLRSSRDAAYERRGTTVLEAVIATSVVLALLALGIWFFVAAGSPLPHQ